MSGHTRAPWVDVLGLATDLIQDQASHVDSHAIRCATLLTRQALEQALEALWRAKAPGLIGLSHHAQLICLPEYLPDRQLAHRVRCTWSALSQACHHHAYELTPTVMELQGWTACVAELREALSEATRPGG